MIFVCITMRDTLGNVYLTVKSVVPIAMLTLQDGTELNEQNYNLNDSMNITFTRIRVMAVM